VARLTNPERLEHYQTALSFWSCTCYVHWKQLAAEWVYANLEGLTVQGIGQLMFEHVSAGGEIDEVEETRPQWRVDCPFHYALRFALPDGRRAYVETILDMGKEPDDSTINVVSIHDE
jgi:hypothetical protein